jgi:hypothetical protein
LFLQKVQIHLSEIDLIEYLSSKNRRYKFSQYQVKWVGTAVKILLKQDNLHSWNFKKPCQNILERADLRGRTWQNSKVKLALSRLQWTGYSWLEKNSQDETAGSPGKNDMTLTKLQGIGPLTQDRHSWITSTQNKAVKIKKLWQERMWSEKKSDLK